MYLKDIIRGETVMMKVAVVKGKGKAFEAACNNWFLEHKKAEIHKVSFALIDNTIPVAFILYNERDSVEMQSLSFIFYQKEKKK